MRARLRSWWQKIRKLLAVVGIIVACVLGIGLVVGIIGGYLFNWGWTGIKTKTLWDWLNLLGVLAIPVVVGFGAVWFTVRHNNDIELARAQHENDLRITLDNQRETMLQTYLDNMSELLLHKNLRKSKGGDDVANIAHARTSTILPKLDCNRKRSVILFLAESRLIDRGRYIIDMSFADLRGVNLSQAKKLDGVTLEGAYLQGANLSGANLSNVIFQGANLHHANLSGTDLREADFNYADLRGPTYEEQESH